MRKTLSLVLALVLMLSMNLGTVAYAAAPTNTEANAEAATEVSTQATRASTSAPLEFSSGHTASASLLNVGAFPTITVTISGNPNMLFSIVAKSSNGVTIIADDVPADGSSVSKFIWAISATNYIIEVRPSGGSSSGQKYSGTVTATW